MECTLYLTDNCNLKCSYCYEGNKKNKSYMDEKTLMEALKFIIENNLPEDTIDLLFLGGEPLMNKSVLFKAIHIINEKYKEVKHLFKYQITTNGLLLDKKTADFMQENNFSISISIDGDKDTHNLNRKSTNGKDVYDIIIKNMRYMLECNIDFTVRMTVTANNANLLYKNILYFYDMGIRNINIGIDHTGDWSNEEIKKMDEQLAFTDHFYMDKIAEDDNAVLNIYDYKLTTFVYKRTPAYCSAGSTNHIIINSSGELFPCGYVFNEETWKLGNVKTVIDRRKFIEAARSHVNKISSCKECEIAFTCSGAKCGFLNYVRTGLLNLNHETTCELENVLYKHNKCVIEDMYRRDCPKLMRLIKNADNCHIPLGNPILKIIEKVEKERKVV